jgi:hypothetical protein
MSVAGSGNAGNAGNAGAAGSEDPIERMPLPGESRIHEHTLNLVDADAEAQLIAFLLDGTLDLELPAQRFYEVFPDEYDFLFFVTDRPIDGAASGTHKSVRETPIVGTGITGHETFFEYYSHEKLRSVLAINRSPGAFPPFGHEVMHDFANFLDESFGFGHDGELDIGPHWGLTSVFGQLGGFDASTLRCETPAGAMPPDCTPLASGRTRYVLGSFGPHRAVLDGADSALRGPGDIHGDGRWRDRFRKLHRCRWHGHVDRGGEQRR